ncbi:MAG TPA: 50S ribosomal protein L4 [Elusimicrobia bacterium]|nr:50S ribosomal protein L4 [Elusimicrobiota bacterium]
METKLLNLKGQEVGKYELPEVIFARKADPYFLYEAVKYYLANRRRGTSCTKTRGEVSGGGRKPWKQKGTGRARSGTIRSPLWRKGGVVFGPRPRSYRQDMPAEKLRQALIDALSAMHAAGSVTVVDSLTMEQPKTRELQSMFSALNLGSKKALFVLDKADKKLAVASRNLSHVEWCLAANLNAYQVLSAGRLIFTAAALNGLGSKLAV